MTAGLSARRPGSNCRQYAEQNVFHILSDQVVLMDAHSAGITPAMRRPAIPSAFANRLGNFRNPRGCCTTLGMPIFLPLLSPPHEAGSAGASPAIAVMESIHNPFPSDCGNPRRRIFSGEPHRRRHRRSEIRHQGMIFNAANCLLEELAIGMNISSPLKWLVIHFADRLPSRLLRADYPVRQPRGILRLMTSDFLFHGYPSSPGNTRPSVAANHILIAGFAGNCRYY